FAVHEAPERGSGQVANDIGDQTFGQAFSAVDRLWMVPSSGRQHARNRTGVLDDGARPADTPIGKSEGQALNPKVRGRIELFGAGRFARDDVDLARREAPIELPPPSSAAPLLGRKDLRGEEDSPASHRF